MNPEVLSLRRDAHEISGILYEGAIWRHGQRLLALPRELVANPGGVETVVFEIVQPSGVMRPIWVLQWIKALGIENLALTLVPAASVLVYGLLKGWHFSGWVGCLALLGVTCFHLAVNLFSEVQDHLSLSGLSSARSSESALQRGWLTPKQVRNLGFLALALGVLAGLPAVVHAPRILLGIGSASFLGVMAYSHKPSSLRATGLGDLILVLLLGPLLTLGYSLAFFGTQGLGILWLGLFYGFMAWGIHQVSQISRLGGGSGGSGSLAAFLGYRSSRIALLMSYLLSWGTLCLAISQGELPPFSGLLVLSQGLWIGWFVSQIFRASGPASVLLSSSRSEAVRIYFFCGALLTLGVAFELFR